MKKILLSSFSILLVLLSFTAYAQPTVLYTGLTTTTPAPSNSRFTLNTVGGFRQVRFQSNQSVAVSTTGWAFHTGSTGSPNYSPNWRPFTSNNTLSSNTFIPTSFANGAKYNSSGGGVDGLLPAITSGNYYTFNVSANAAADNVMSLLETSFNPVTVSTVTSAVGTYGSRTVSITTSGTPASGENIYVRYTTNSFTNSTLVQATGSGTTWSATIPWQSSAVTFYVYTSNRSQSSIEADVVTYGQGVHDMSTLNLNNNSGSNYSWTPPTGNVIVTSAGGTFATPIGYSTLTVAANAFAALNGAAAGTGAVTILITGNTTETGAVTLNASANWTSIGIRPNGARTLSGNVALPLIGLSGADNVTIDGLNSGGNSLTISNTSTATTSGTATITFSGDATNNTITNCSVLGSSPNTNLGNANGVIVFSTGTTSGNDGNTISNCTISSAGANNPSRAIHSVGTTTTTTHFNSGITINNCLISDYFLSGNVHAGIFIGAGNTDWTISNNKFFQSANRVAGSTSAQHSAINIGNGSSTNTGNNYTITGNTFGYATSTGTGNYVVGAATFPTASGSAFAAIRMIYMAVGTTTASNIQGNTFANINFATTGTGTGSSSKLSIVYISAGLVNIGNTTPNTFGSLTGTGSIAFSTNQSGTNDFNVVYNFGVSSFNCSNNIFGSITATTTNAGATTLYVIRNNTDAAVTFTCQGNTIGGTTASSIQNTSTNAAGGVTAIQNELAIANISTNTITNLTAAAASGNVRGINNTSGEALTINQNTINTLSGTGATAPVVSGIAVASGATVAISKNKIYDLAASSAGGTTNGIIISTAATLSNNIIGDLRAATGTQTSPAISVAGINVAATTGTVNVYYNTVNLSAAAGGTNFGTAALYANTGSTLNSINNILVNSSVANGTGKATAYQRSGTTLTSYASTSNNNLYYSGTPGASRVIFFDGTNSDQTLTAYKTRVSTRDNLSVSENPTWVSTTGSNATFLHIDPSTPTSIESGGAVISGLTDDFDAVGVRSATTPDIGADEFTGTPLPAPDVTSINTSSLCAGITDVIITGTGFSGITAVNFNGVASSFTVNSTTQITATTPLTATAGTIQVVNSTGSDVSSAYTVTTQSVEPSSLVAAQPTICNGASTTLTQTGGSLGAGASWQWYTDNNFTTTVGSPTVASNASLSVSPTTTTTYYLRAINGTSPCATSVPINTPATISVTVTVNSVPTATAANNGPLCAGSTINLTAGPNGQAAYAWTGPNSFVNSATQTITQNFDGLLNTGTATWVDNSTLAGWYSQRTGTGTSIIADAGSGTAGSLYSYGTGTNTDRALGATGSGNAAAGSFAHGVLIQNTTGFTVTNITVSYTLEQWRKSGVTTPQSVIVSYKTSASPITSLSAISTTDPPTAQSGWTGVAGLTLSSPTNTATGTALDGNAGANRVTATNVSIGSISLPANNYIMIKWEDPDHSGTDHALAIDDVTVTLTYANQNPSIANVTVANAGVYNLTVTGTNGCVGTASTTVVINEPSTAAVLSGTTSICYGGTANLQVAITGGTSPFDVVYTDGTSNFTVNGYTSGTNIPVSPSATTTYSLVSVTSTGGCAGTGNSGTPTVTVQNTWLGGTGDWNTGSNWCTGVAPLSTDDVFIPAAATPYPSLSGAANTYGLNIETGATVNLGSNTLTINGAVTGTGTITGSNTSGLTINGAAGSLRFTSGGTNNYLNAFTIGASGSATLATALNITAWDGTNEGVLTVTPGGTLASAGFLSIRSNINGTARIAPGSTSGGYITGGVSVERYIPQNSSKGWRLLASTASGQTINFCWQENQVGGMLNNVPGFGTKITAGNTITTNLATAQAAGFDTLSAGNALFKYNKTTDGLEPVTATNTGNIGSEQGYFLFIRGDRSPGGFGGGAPTAPTVLRTKGTLFEGDQAQVFTGTPGYALVRNPYPSRIDMRNIVRGSLLIDAFQVWDAKLGGSFGVGAYQTFAKSGSDYVVTPGGGSYGSNGSPQNFIESGAAFFVQATGNNGVDNYVQVTEACKTSASSNNSFRPATPAAGEGRLSFNLLANNAGNYDIVDGGLVFFNNTYSNDVTVEDVRKSSNFNENFGMVRSNVQLVVEKRQQANVNDTIFFSMNQLRQIQYRLDVEAMNIDPLITTAILEDHYTNTNTAMDLGTLNSYTFTVDANAVSKAADRFRIVFRQTVVVPVSFISVRAAQSGHNISVEWNVANEVNTVKYEVEKSADGRNFSAKGAVEATGKGTYNWLDENVMNGYNYYRIRSVDNNGAVKYTQVVKVQVGGKAGITVSPNPVQGNFVNIHFANQEVGKYGIQITNIAGQAVYNKEVTHNGGSASQSFVLPSSIVSGIYQLQVIAPDNTKHTEKLVINQGN